MTHIMIFSSRTNGMQSKKNSHTENTIVLIQSKMAFIFLDTQEIDKILHMILLIKTELNLQLAGL